MQQSPLSKLVFGDDREVPLPLTRKQSFSFYGKLHFWKLLLLGALTSLGFLPSLFWLFARNYAKAEQLDSLVKDTADYIKQYNTILVQHALSDGLVLIPLLMLFFVMLSGLFGIVKRMAFCQSSGYGEYFSAIRKNGLPFALCGAGFGISLFFLSYHISYYGISTLSPVAKGIFTGIAILQFTAVTMITVYLLCGISVYRNTARGHIQNAFRLTLGTFWASLFLMGAVFLPAVLTWLLPSPFQLIPLALMPLFYLGFAVLALTCYCNSVFDRYINPTLGEEYVGIGLQKP